MANKSERTPLFNVRTTQMTDEMYDYVLKRLEEHGTFREYAFHLIQNEMKQEEQSQINKEKDKHVYDALIELKHGMDSQFRHLNRKIEQKNFNLPFDVSDDSSNKKNEENFGTREGQLVRNSPPTGEINEDFDMDF
ncbi:hypothetical protein SAMN04489762_3436 [Terribacillus saccharophilus]|uniref:Uncharacterized protein n=1 Tax=Terribacillus saccharophilus TaxID=361277 RepID=A0AAX2EJR4_9BACI|nr:hypothetical protein SAMN04489762_3436 [Terribacillus saccharophilus]